MKVQSERIIIDVSNLSIHAKKFIRTGIQEVIYKTLLSMVKVRHEFPNLEIILLPQLPRRFGNVLMSSTLAPFQNPNSSILEAIEEELRLSSQEIWGLDLKKENFSLSDH